jgi:hypothetical protein
MDLTKYNKKSITNAWSKVCLIADGMAINTTVYALKISGILDFIHQAKVPVKVDNMINLFNIKNRGYFHLTFRLLEDQGIIERFGDIYHGQTKVLFSVNGKEWYQHLNDYNKLEGYIKLTTYLLGYTPPNKYEVTKLTKYLNNYNNKPKIEQINIIHVTSSFIAVFLKKLKTNGFFNNAHGKEFKFEINQLKISNIDIAQLGFNYMIELGWIIKKNENNFILTEEGAALQVLLSQLDFTISYLTTAFNVQKLLFNKITNKTRLGDLESHIDRLLDVTFSGGVYLKHCQKTTHEIILIIFNKLPINEQPQYITDTGSGNGVMLIDIYNFIVGSTIRGMNLKEYPLKMIGVEYTNVAKKTTEKNLKKANVPHLTIYGDITFPDQIMHELNKHGIKSDEILHVSKSVIHNRTYIEPESNLDYYSLKPSANNVFVDKSGELIDAGNIEVNLIEHFKRWSKWTQKHGMLAIEAHSINPKIISKTLGNNVFTAFDAEHGYSNQYLIEHDVYLKMAANAGYNSSYNGVIISYKNEVVLSINYFQNCRN